jgi:hypothetical protein
MGQTRRSNRFRATSVLLSNSGLEFSTQHSPARVVTGNARLEPEISTFDSESRRGDGDVSAMRSARTHPVITRGMFITDLTIGASG